MSEMTAAAAKTGGATDWGKGGAIQAACAACCRAADRANGLGFGSARKQLPTEC